VKRRDLVNHLTREGCILQREGHKHSVYLNPENGHIATVPRHREIEILLVKKYVANWIFSSLEHGPELNIMTKYEQCTRLFSILN
jgi:mRNA interferase HicA